MAHPITVHISNLYHAVEAVRPYLNAINLMGCGGGAAPSLMGCLPGLVNESFYTMYGILKWIEEYISMAKVLALVNESPTKEFAMKKKRIKVR
ncbi:Uncharacterized protein TCM_025319 [Theobroma cacao]|uniref:Uncharacterized protein n=1 Tax=Theobroma cacao TaxID=3641 RepID=A0A061EXX5_THECC|nr:Uncharacterized protein TCM_025319 [Theobroma cacao]